MTLFGMKILTGATIFLLCCSVGTEVAKSFDFESLTTTADRHYQEVFVLESDQHGLTFRHRYGIAKVPFGELSMNLRMLYEPVGEVGDPGAPDLDAESTEVFLEEPDYAIATVRTTITAPLWWWQGALTQMPRPCPPVVWPSHWPRYHPAHALAVPAYRELAVRDFLYTTGLAPRPCGVHPYPLPRHGPYPFLLH